MRVQVSPGKWDRGPASAHVSTNKFAVGAVTGASMVPVLTTPDPLTAERREKAAAYARGYRARQSRS